MNSGGSEQRILDIRGAAEPAWSLTEKIAYVIDIGRGKESWDNEEICVINAEGSGRTRLTEIPDNDHWPPTWSPDSTRIAFTSDGTDRLGEVYVMNSDGTGLTKLTDAPSGMLGSEPPAVMFTAWRP